MNECTEREVQELLPELLHRTLMSGDRERVELHLATCESCREELAVLRQVKGAAVFAPAIDVGQIVRQIPPYQRIAPPAQAPSRARIGQWLTAAAAVLLVIGGGSVLVNRQANSIAPVASESSPVQTRVGSSVITADPVVVSTSVASAPSPTHAYALASDVSSLSDGDLVQLMNDMDDFDALPGSEPEPVIAVDSAGSF
ncbi:MAG TPA: zf-HC2 domain-containing protein [Gemmatimonadaceae bacterium]|nr:zf-HC2 domain-containing protein [Gemmatimonadaceae bacterium]